MINMKEILIFTVEQKASDLHVAVGIPPKLRVNGRLVEIDMDRLSPSDVVEALGSVMNDRQKAVLKEKGEVDFSYASEETGRFRVNVFMDRGNMAAAFRRVDTIIPKPEELGLTSSIVELYKKRRGLVLVTGPTGSGKSTTLASVINKANANLSDCHIITLEDPIEYVHRHNKSIVNQREVGMDTLSYANALRAALREDPDIILLGEMRDLETISTAITAAETGHLVFSTLHTIGAASTIDRIVDVFPTHQQQQVRVQLSMVLEAVISQQLLPTIEGNGRVAAFEIMLATPAIRSLIRDAKTHQIMSTIQTSKAQGMITMDDALYELYRNGMISRDMAFIYSQDPAALRKKM